MPQPDPRHSAKRYRITLHQKAAVVFCLFAALVAGLTTLVLYRTAQAQMLEDIRRRLHDLVQVAATAVDTDLHDALQDPAQEGGPQYMAIKKTLQTIRDAASDIHFVYTMRRGRDGRIIFVVDAENNPAETAHLGEAYEDASELLRQNFADMNAAMVEDDFYTDQWGTWLSGYAPILRPDGSRAGVVGMDISASSVLAYEKTLISHALATIGLIMPVILLAGYLVGRTLARPIMKLRAGAERMEGGDLTVRFNLERNDEIGDLATSMDRMAAALEDQRHQVRMLAQKYRGIVDNAVEGIFQSTTGGELLTANPALARMLGYGSVDELLASVDELARNVYGSADDRRAFLAELGEGEGIEHRRMRLRRKDGTALWVEISAHRAVTEEGVPAVEGMVQDISQRMAKEKAEEERRAAQAASKAKSEFLANMSHEIRTPLNAVMGLTDLLLKGQLTDKQRERMGKIRIAGQTLLAVINDILDFSKIEAGRLELENSGFSIFEVMANLSEMFAFSAHEKDLELIVKVDEGTPQNLIGDPVRLGQVLINLTGNALKFTEKGEVVVTVGPSPDAPELPEDQVMLLFSVTDSGEGIPPDRLGQIFDSFTQADATITRRHGGTGLGLTICKQLTRLMGGDITVRSTPGRGSTFAFTAVFQLRPEDQLGAPVTPQSLQGLRVLVVDDNATARQILIEIIESFRMHAEGAASGEEAVEIIGRTSEPYDLILLDWKMPGLNGIDTARNIRRDSRLGKPPIICMISAYGREDLIQPTEKSLLDAFLHKPINQSLLFDTIMGLFGRHDISSGVVSPLSQAPQAPTHDFSGAKVLLVEDNEINREVAREWLQSVGLEVDEAIDGRKALAALESEAYDLVFMDIQMPVLDGLAATRLIRQNPGLADLPVIAMTAHALKGDREKAIEAGMTDYLTKPIDPEKLFATLHRYLGDRPADGTMPPAPAAPQAAQARWTGPQLPGISVENGLYRSNHNLQLYLKLLGTFLRDFEKTAAEIKQALADGRPEDARIKAHSLKGVAGNIGANDLSRSAALVEGAIQQNQLDHQSEMWQDFLREIEIVISGLRDVLPELAPPPPRRPAGQVLPLARIKEILNRLAAKLDDDLDEANELFGQIRPSLESRLGDRQTAALERLIDEFDIDGAVECIERMAAEIGNQEN